MIKKLLTIVVFFIALFTCISCGKSSNSNSNSTTDSNQLLFMKSDLKLTQEQVLSQIKAEYLKENNGYKDDDIITSIITLSDDSIIDVYNNKYSNVYQSVAEFAQSKKGLALAKSIAASQDALINKLLEDGLIEEVSYQYNTIVNAIAVTTKYKNLESISSTQGVTKALISDTYNLPTTSTTSGSSSAVENIVDVYSTGIFDSSSVSYTGSGTAVAILDSGFDCSHEVFATQPDEELLTLDSISGLLHLTNAFKLNDGVELSDVYYSRKIPFVYDYADKDSDVFPYDSEHGTHVAGIIGGSSDTITGVAVNTQLVLLKVFPDLDDGASTDDILAALEDAVLLGVDCINMSLGSSCGFVREEDGNIINDVYDKIDESGISLITAASNSYSSGYGGTNGNTNLVSNPDSATVGSPSTYQAALSVASISGTKSKYLIANDSYVFFFTESNSITAKANDFIKELGLSEGQTKTYEYVTIPGSGLKVNYASVGDLTGKIALIRRGDNTFEEKALLAKNAGAIACIIYNNVEGDITMSMGNTEHIPTISISKEAGTVLASQSTGTITVSYDYQAGPFMSDFSSWGPTPSLELKPEITAHGGNILSSVPGGGYDELSGTSMATPNLCGIVVLIRQYLKEKYPEYTSKQISVLANQLLMSTATIVLNEEGNPYSPRKQGAGLASLYNAVNTSGYITVDGTDRTKIELYDDPNKTGVYTMEFNVVNTSNSTLKYTLDLAAMTESVSTSDSSYVAEKANLLTNNFTCKVTSNGTYNDGVISVNPNSTAKVTVVFTMTDEDKAMMDELFPYGMYVEGFIKLISLDEDIDLNVPFLAFYGDWTQAPMFDKTYYEVESEAHDDSIDDEDKIKADYYATTPYGSYYYNYIIPLGTYLYDIDTSAYDAIPASTDHIAISNYLGTIDGISSVYAGLLRNAKTMTFTITDKLTGEVLYEYVDYNATKAYSYGGSAIPYYNYLKIKSANLDLVNNREYEFKMVGTLDYGDGGVSNNARNSFTFDFTLDDEAPILKNVSYEKVYDKTLKKDRYYMTMTIYDNQYVQSITPIIFTSSSSYTFLTDNPIPVYSQKGTDNTVRFEITDFLEEIYSDGIITSALAFSIDDYALNSNIYICQLPGTLGDFKFTKDGTYEGDDLLILTANVGDVIDLTQYLATSDSTVDADKDYLKYLQWSSSNENIAEVQEGFLKAKAAGKVTITVSEQMDGKQAILIVNIKNKKTRANAATTSSTIQSLRFSYFDTIFAYSRSAQTSEIGSTGDRKYILSLSSGISFYPGEKIQLFYDLDPWYVADNYELTYTSTNPSVATVDQDGVVTALKKGSTNITLSVAGSNIMARIKVTVKSEFVIEDRTLVAYKGLGGEVVIPDDEGILYIGSYAFCLYDTDTSIELTDDDYDANKIPSTNTSVTSVVIPDGVEEIQKYAFYNCKNLKSVTLPSTVKYVREYSFYNDAELKTINTESVEVIGAYAFSGCVDLESIATNKLYTIGLRSFDGCTSLTTIDLTNLRNTGAECFRGCTSLKSVTLTANTKLSAGMFAKSGLETVDIYEKVQIPAYTFANCTSLKTVNIYNDLVYVGMGAFSGCSSLEEVNFHGTVDEIKSQAFYNCTSLKAITLPNSTFVLGSYAFYKCNLLQQITFNENTYLSDLTGVIFEGTSLDTFIINENNSHYIYKDNYLMDKDASKIIFGKVTAEYGDLVIDEDINEIGSSAFAGCNITSVTFMNPDIIIGDYAFANCTSLVTVNFSQTSGAKVGKHAFDSATAIDTINNLESVVYADEYAFANTTIKEVTLGSNATYEEGAFFKAKLEKVTIGENTSFGLGVFQYCSYLQTVVMPEGGNVHIGRACFAYCVSLSKIDLTKIDETLEEEAFYGCTSLKAVSLDNTKYIGSYAFADCSALAYVSIPVAVTIGEGSFARYSTDGGAPTFTAITLPNTLTSIGDGAFLGCEGLLEISIPSSVTSYGNYLFAYCVNLLKVTLPENRTSIGLYEYAGCELLSSINLENIKSIDSYGLAKTSSLTTIDLSSIESIGDAAFASSAITGNYSLENLKTIGMYAFQSTNILSFYAPNLEVIGDAAFQGNTNLTEFYLGKKITSVGLLAFYECSSLKTFYTMVNDERELDGAINDYAYLDDGILYAYTNSVLQLLAVPAAKDISTLIVIDGCSRVELYAGNANKNVTKIVLPDSLEVLGNYAFYGYDALTTVEFKSVQAPVLESYYNSNASLSTSDFGYDIVHKYYDLFGLELCYYTFIDLVGKNNPISMILPANSDISGYDGLIYELYFGNVDSASRSDYVAMEANMVNFISYAKSLLKVDNVSLNEETLINNAITAYNAIKQDYKDYGISEEDWKTYVDKVNTSKETVRVLKLKIASLTVQNMQKELDNLEISFDISKFAYLQDLTTRMQALKFDERNLLDLTNYTQVQTMYDAYRESVNDEANQGVEALNHTFAYVASTVAIASAISISIFAIKKIKGIWR